MTIKMIVVFSLTAQQNKNKRSILIISQYRKYQRANDEKKKTYLALQ